MALRGFCGASGRAGKPVRAQFSWNASSFSSVLVYRSFRIERSPRPTAVTRWTAVSARMMTALFGSVHSRPRPPSRSFHSVTLLEVFSRVRTTSYCGSAYSASSRCQSMEDPRGYMRYSMGNSPSSTSLPTKDTTRRSVSGERKAP